MAVIAIYSLKGGVGKTTLAVNLAWCAAARSARRTLLWDLDPQAASTFLLKPTKNAASDAQAAFTKDVDVRKLARATAIERLAVIAADASLRDLDHVFHALDKKKRLARLIEQLESDYDRIILDCPPGLTDTSEQVMRAADVIVVPVVPSALSVRAYHEVAGHLDRLRGGKVRVIPVHAMVDRRRSLHARALAEHPDWPVIPMASMIESMATREAPLGSFAPRSAPAQAFDGLWQVVEKALSTGK